MNTISFPSDRVLLKYRGQLKIRIFMSHPLIAGAMVKEPLYPRG